MRAPARWLFLAMLAIGLGSCDEVTTETQTTTLTAELVVEGSPFVAAGDTLVGDTVEFTARVTDDAGRPFSVGDLEFSSAESNIVEILDPSTGRAFLAAPGTTTVSVTIGEPILQGAAQPLAADMEISVVDFGVVVDVASLVPGSDHLANGQVLVTDSVQFSATVMKGGEEVPVSGAQWSSSDPAVIEIVDENAGVAAFRTVGEATVSVDFTDPLLPGAPFRRTLTVSTFEVELEATSDFDGPGLSDPLVTDRVTFNAVVTLDGEVQPSTIGELNSSNSDVVEPTSASKAVFRSVGDATVTAVLSEPVLPRDTLRPEVAVQVATITATISGPTETPIMGDNIDYDVTVTRTRDNSTVSNPTVTFSSTDPNVISITNQATGAAFVRDTGTARVAVVSVNPTLPNGVVSDTTDVTNITVERFYGQFSRTSGSFGQSRNADTVIVERSQEHRFTPSTRIQFPNGIPGFVERVKPDSLIFLVPAGASTGPLTLRNLIDQEGDARDGVLTTFDFNGPGGNAADDFFEDNDAFPLPNPSAVNLTNQLPFVALLAIDPTKVAPRDTNFFWLRNPGPGDLVVDITAENQQNLDIDFFVCIGTGGTSSDPPTGYDDDVCARPRSLNTTNTQLEQELGEQLQQGRHVFGFYCRTSCPSVPVSYKVSIVPD